MSQWFQNLFTSLRLELPSDRKVDFLICGAQKSGTSALNKYLSYHPSICMADSKEVHYFDNEELHLNEKPNYSEYHSFFSGNSSGQLVGEATPIYMYWKPAPRRIRRYNPNIKIIIVLRHPVDRAYSHWNMERDRGREARTFLQAIHDELLQYQHTSHPQDRVYSYLDRGFYLSQLKRLHRYFPAEQLLILKYDNFCATPLATLNVIFDFLNVARLSNIKKEVVHGRPYASKITPDERAFLFKLYSRELMGIEELLGHGYRDWLPSYCA